MGESTARLGIYADDRASATIKSVQGTLQKLAHDAKSSILTGVGLGAGISLFGAMKNAVRGAADALGDMVQSAIADETSVARLTAALRANVPGWDGRTEAIERTIAAGERLGFTDDDTRASLAFLTAATHDVTKAQELHNTAMDLARFKGISLQTASEALVKVEAGRFRILASLGIQLHDGATATEALAAVQAVAAGQAQKFGDTTAGAMAGAGIAMEEAGEALGTTLAPAIKDIAEFVRDDLAPALENLGELFEEQPGQYDAIADSIYNLTGGMFGMSKAMQADQEQTEAFIDTLRDLPPAAREALVTGAGQVTEGARAMAHGIQEAARNARQDAVKEARAIPGDVARAMLEGMDDIQAVMDQVQTLLADEWTDASRLAYLKGQLIIAEEGLAAGIAQGDSAAVSAAQEAVALVMAEIGLLEGGVYAEANASMTTLETVLRERREAAGRMAADVAKAVRHNLAFDATDIGHNVGKTYGDGLAAAYAYVFTKAQQLANAARHHLEFEGSPAYTHSREIGEMVAKTYGQGIASGLGKLPNVSGLLPGGAGGGGGNLAGGGGELHIHTHVNLDGREIAENTTRWQYFMGSTTALLPKG